MNLNLKDSIKLTFADAGHALDTFFLVNRCNLFLLPRNSIDRAALGTETALFTFDRIHFKFQKRRTCL